MCCRAGRAGSRAWDGCRAARCRARCCGLCRERLSRLQPAIGNQAGGGHGERSHGHGAAERQPGGSGVCGAGARAGTAAWRSSALLLLRYWRPSARQVLTRCLGRRASPGPFLLPSGAETPACQRGSGPAGTQRVSRARGGYRGTVPLLPVHHTGGEHHCLFQCRGCGCAVLTMPAGQQLCATHSPFPGHVEGHRAGAREPCWATFNSIF